jgi:hypothetical protein
VAGEELALLRGEVLALRAECARVAALRDDLLQTTSSLTSARLTSTQGLAAELNAGAEERRALLLLVAAAWVWLLALLAVLPKHQATPLAYKAQVIRLQIAQFLTQVKLILMAKRV